MATSASLVCCHRPLAVVAYRTHNTKHAPTRLNFSHTKHTTQLPNAASKSLMGLLSSSQSCTKLRKWRQQNSGHEKLAHIFF